MNRPDSERGLYGKYRVERVYDPNGKHTRCFYFVLDVQHDKFARLALAVYAAACAEEYPVLAVDLFRALALKGRCTPEDTDARHEDDHP
jgi:hypothetical protein